VPLLLRINSGVEHPSDRVDGAFLSTADGSG
jgi:hypothetical protein